MRVTSPPKYHKQTNKSKSPIKPQLNKQSVNNQKPVIIHHLRSPSKISTTKTQTKITLKQNLYAQLKSRQHQYVELIKDLHQQNKNLKQQIVKLQHDQSHQFANQSVHLSPRGAGFNQATNGYNVFKMIDNQKMMNRTFSNFTSPPKIIQNHNDKQQQQNTSTSFKSPFSKKTQIMSNTLPDGFGYRPSTSVRNNSPCIRPVSNFNPNSYTLKQPDLKPQIRTANHSYQPSLISYYPSQNQTCRATPKNFQSLQVSPKKKLQITHVINTAVKSISPNKIVFKQTDNSKQSNQSHLNPLTSKIHKQSKSVNIQQQQNKSIKSEQKQQNVDDLDKKIDQNPLLSMLKKRLQQGEFLNSEMREQNIEESQCVEFIKPSEYNHNIRYSSDSVKVQETPQVHIIHPLKRNILTGFPILNQLRMAHSEYEKEDEVPVQQKPVRQPSAQQVSVQLDVENISSYNNYKTKQSLNLRSQLSRDSRLSQKISKQSESQPLIQQKQSRKQPLTIIRMLQQNLREKAQTQQNMLSDRQISSNKEIEPLTNVYNNNKSNHCNSVNLIGLERQSFQNIDQPQQNQQNLIMANNNNTNNSNGSQLISRPMNFNNRLYCQQTQENIIIQSQKSIKQHHNVQQQQNNTKSNTLKNRKKVSINQDVIETNYIPSSTNKIIKSPQFSIVLNENEKQQKQQQQQSFDLKGQPKDQSIEITQDELCQYRNNFNNNNRKQDHRNINLNNNVGSSQKHHLTDNNNSKIEHNNNSLMQSQKLSKTSPIQFYQSQQLQQHLHSNNNNKNKKYVDNNTMSLTTKQWQSSSSSSSTIRSLKYKKITNQAYL